MLLLRTDISGETIVNYYSSLCKIKKWWIHEDRFVIPLTPLKYMVDSREGWGKLPLEYKDILSSVASFMNRVELEGEIFECPICTIKSFSNLSFLENNYPSLVEVQDTFSRYLEYLKNTAIRSFFATNTINEALNSRYMWNLYGEMGKESQCDCNKPVLLSFKWQTLKSSFEASLLDLEAGLVDYQNSDDVLFYKDQSYAHEREFRIAIKSLEKGSRIIIDDKAEITAFMPDFSRADEQFFANIGFSTANEKDTRRLKKCKIYNEAGHPDSRTIEDSLKLLDTLDPNRWNKIMK
jgi:hypothetical protein